MEFFTTHWAELLLALITFLGTYTALTETTKDDRFFVIKVGCESGQLNAP